MKSFKDAGALLARVDRSGNGRKRPLSHAKLNESEREAASLLYVLGYVELEGPDGTLRATSANAAQRQNWLAQLALAARCENAFRLPLPHAPGAEFFGAMVDPLTFGISEHERSGAGGRGVTFQHAFGSCIGEAAEYLSFLEHPDDPLIIADSGPDEHSPDTRQWIAAGLGLEGGADPGSAEQTEMRSISDGHSVNFPAELVLRRAAARRSGRRPAESTGVGAGPTIDDAILSGLLEVIERDAIALWWYGGRPARPTAPDLSGGSEFQRFMNTIRPGDERRCWLLDLTTDIEVPVCAALSSEQDGSQVIAGFAARPDPFDAACTALLELCQMELAQDISVSRWRQNGEDALNAQDRMWVQRHEQLSVATHPRLIVDGAHREHPDPPGQDGLSHVLTQLGRIGFEAFFCDLTRQSIGVPVVRVVVPGLQSSKPDWISQRLIECARSHDCSLNDAGSLVSPI